MQLLPNYMFKAIKNSRCNNLIRFFLTILFDHLKISWNPRFPTAFGESGGGGSNRAIQKEMGKLRNVQASTCFWAPVVNFEYIQYNNLRGVLRTLPMVYDGKLSSTRTKSSIWLMIWTCIFGRLATHAHI